MSMPGLAQEALDRGHRKPVELIVTVQNAIPVGVAAPDHLDAPRAIRGLHRVRHHASTSPDTSQRGRRAAPPATGGSHVMDSLAGGVQLIQ